MRVLSILLLLGTTTWAGAAGESDFWPEVAQPGVKRYRAALKRADSLLQRIQRLRAELAGLPPAMRGQRVKERASLLRGLRRDATVAAKEAVAAAPGKAGGYLVLAKIAYHAERYGEFVTEVNKARQRSKTARDDHMLAFEMGIAYSKLGDFRSAVKEYDRLERILWRKRLSSSVRGTAHGNAAESLMALGRLDEAIERYRSAVAYESDPLLFWGLGVALDRDEQMSKSKDALRKALGADGSGMRHLTRSGVFFVPEGDVHYYRGVGYLAQGKAEEARKSFELFLKEVPKSQWAYRARAHISALKRWAQPRKMKRGLAPTPKGVGANEDLVARDRRNFTQGVRGEYYSLRRCYQRVLSSGGRSAKKAGVMRIALTIGKNGRASSVAVLSSTLRSPRLKECVLRRLRQRYYGRPISQQRVRLVVPIRFEPS